MTVLGLDLGTKCGWAVDSDGQLHSGTWQLTPSAKSLDVTKGLTLQRRLAGVLEAHGPIKLVAFERVDAHGRPDEKKCPHCAKKLRVNGFNTLAAQAYGGFREVMLAWCDLHRIPTADVAVGTLKKFATGSGRATKQEMVVMAQFRWRDQQVKDDNQADALHVLDWALVEVVKRRGKAVMDARDHSG